MPSLTEETARHWWSSRRVIGWEGERRFWEIMDVILERFRRVSWSLRL